MRRATVDERLRRAVDIAFASGGLIIAAPVMGVCALAVKAEDRGPVLFRQERVGINGLRFHIRKFRTMRMADAPGLQVSTSDDERITSVGRVLRRTKLDELPQLIDVLVGSMSMVGPRPEVPKYVAHWKPEHRDVILSVRPGITDPTSIWLRDEANVLAGVEDPEEFYIKELLPMKAERYREYVERRSLASDLRTLLDTVVAVAKLPAAKRNG